MLDLAHLNTKLAIALAFAALAASAPACSKTESGTTTDPAAASASATPKAAMSAAAAPDASPMAADTTTGTTPTGGADATAPTTSANAATPTAAGADASASGGGTPVASGSAGAAAACGTKPLPDCPLQAWMKANTNPAIAAQDFPALATALDKVATFAPPGYTNWASIAKDGAKAARASDMTATKASCRTCHDQYKDKYKKELRARKI